MYKAIIFDFFDVIHADHQRVWLQENGLKREGAYAEASDLVDRGDIDFEDYLRRYSEASGIPVEQIKASYASYATIDEGVVNLIKQLKSSFKIGLVSNAHGDELRPIMTRHNLFEIFDEICISSEVGVAKPDPEIFQFMLDRLAVNAKETIFIDDNSNNVAGAEALGITGIVFTDDASLRKRLLQLIPDAAL